MGLASFIEGLRRAGAILIPAGDRLRCEGPEDVITEEMVARLRADKRDILEALERERQAILDAVVEPKPDGSLFDDGEFTRRYLMVARAHRDGIIDEETRRGLTAFLLRSWKPSGEPEGTRQPSMHAEEEQLPSPGDCLNCQAAVSWPSMGPGKWCVAYALFEGKTGWPKPCAEAAKACQYSREQTRWVH